MSAPASAPTIISFTLPLPPSELLPNRAIGKDWRSTYEAKQTYYQACFVECKNVKQAHRNTFPLKPVVTMVLTFSLPTKRRRDGDGLLSAFKTGIDAMVRAGILVDDSIWVLRTAIEGEVGEAGVKVRLEGGS